MPRVCTVCELPARILEEVNIRMTTGQTNPDIVRWLRENRVNPIPSAANLKKHRNNDHFLSNPEGTPTVNDSVVAQGHRDGMNIMQRVNMAISHTVMPRLAMIPKNINELEEMQELYVFTKNQLAVEFQNSRVAPEIYINPVTEDEELIYPTTNGMLKLIPELRRQLKEMIEVKERLNKDMDVESEISIKFMSLMKGEHKLQKMIKQYLSDQAIVNAVVVEPEVEVVAISGTGDIDESS